MPDQTRSLQVKHPVAHAKNKFLTFLILTFLMLAFSAFGGILFGYDCGIISGVQEMKDWLRTFGSPTDDLVNNPTGYTMSAKMQSLVVSMLSVGTIFGSLFAAAIADVTGRKLGIVFSTAIFSVGVAMQTASVHIVLLILGRFVAGIGVGLVSCIVPMYQSECSPKQIRGTVVSAYLFFISVGFLFAAIVNNATQNIDDHSSWRIPIGIQFVWAAILAGGMLLLPESPCYHIKQGDQSEALRSLARITGLPSTHPELQSEFNDIRANLEHRRAEGSSGTYRDCFKKTKNKIALRTWTGIGVQACQMIGGLNYIAVYGTSFFQEAHITRPGPFLIAIILQLAFLTMSVFASWAIERFGRRSLLLIGAIGTTVCSYGVAIVSVTLSDDTVLGSRLMVIFVFLYIAFWAACWGNASWVIAGEIFPLEVRAKAMSLATASNWFWGFLVNFSSPYLVDVGDGSAGLGVKVFFIWGTACLIGFFFTYFLVAETQGLSLEEIDIMYENSTPLKSKQYRAKLKNETNIHSASTNNEKDMERGSVV